MGPLKCEDPNSGQSPEAMQGKDGVDRMPGMDVLGPDLRGMTTAVSPLSAAYVSLAEDGARARLQSQPPW